MTQRWDSSLSFMRRRDRDKEGREVRLKLGPVQLELLRHLYEGWLIVRSGQPMFSTWQLCDARGQLQRRINNNSMRVLLDAGLLEQVPASPQETWRISRRGRVRAQQFGEAA